MSDQIAPRRCCYWRWTNQTTGSIQDVNENTMSGLQHSNQAVGHVNAKIAHEKRHLSRSGYRVS
jgi:hypothetical protein